MQPAPAFWYDTRDYVYIEFTVADSKDVKVNFEETKLSFSCVTDTDIKHENELDLYETIDKNESKHKRTDRSVQCFLRKAQAGKEWPRVTKEKAKLSWLRVDFNKWENWVEDSEDEIEKFDQFSDMMQTMGGAENFPDGDDVEDDDSVDSDDENVPGLE